MRLDRLRIEEFKNLQGLDIDFDETTLSTVIVGHNGTGKSNVLEAIVLIFKTLDLQGPPPFGYAIAYECRGRRIEIEADPEASRAKYSFRVADAGQPIRTVTKKSFYAEGEDGFRQFLPRHVFGYYSGPTNRLEQHFEEHHVRFYRGLLAGKNDPRLRPLFYARNIHSQFVLLAFFSGLDDSQTSFLRDYLGITGLDSVLFVMSEPGWAASKEFKSFGWFWKARGVVRTLLDRLYAQGAALAPMHRSGITVPLGLSRKQKRDHVYLYLPDSEALQRLAAPYRNQKAFFSALESAYISDMIREVEVKATLANGETLAFRELSEGEQQLLLVLGLLKFTQEDESLFLLDEPDTHLNPAWSIQYLDIVSKVVGYPEKSHFIITTHDPLVLAALDREQVQILTRSGSGRIKATPPDSNPRGMGVSALLTSNLFGLRSELDLPTLEMLEQKRILSMKDDLDEGDIRELARINKALEGLGFMDEDRDPLFVLWSRAMARAEREMGVDGPVLTDEQRARLQERGNDLVDDLIEAGREGS